MAQTSIWAGHVYNSHDAEDDLIDRIERARMALGITITEHAKRAGVSYSACTAIRSRKKDPSFTTLNKLAEAVGLQLALVPIDKPRPRFTDELSVSMAGSILEALLFAANRERFSSERFWVATSWLIKYLNRSQRLISNKSTP